MPSTEPEYPVVRCHECDRPIRSQDQPVIPEWLVGAKVKFQCEECRQKHPRAVGDTDVETRRDAESDDVEASDTVAGGDAPDGEAENEDGAMDDTDEMPSPDED